RSWSKGLTFRSWFRTGPTLPSLSTLARRRAKPTPGRFDILFATLFASVSIENSIIYSNRAIYHCMYGKVARLLVQYGERERPERRSLGLLTYAQVAHAPRTVPLTVPYTHLQSAIRPL